MKLNSRATVCNLPAPWDTERSVSAIGWQSVNLIASSAIRFQIQKGIIFELPQLSNMNYQMCNFVQCNWGDSLEPFRSLKVGTNGPYQS